MIHLFSRHDVADYEAWQLLYDRFWRDPHARGAPTRTVYQSLDDPNDITVVHAFKHLDDAQAFIASNELAQTMNEEGVLGKPQIWLTEER